MGQHVDELSVLGTLWNKNVDNFTQACVEHNSNWLFLAAFQHSAIVRPFFYGYLFKQALADRNTTHFFVNQSADVGFRRIR